MIFKTFNSTKELYQCLYNDIFLYIDSLKKNPTLGLATGSSPIPLYKLMIESKRDFSKFITINLDEYVGLPKEHQESYHTFMNKNLFSHINIKPQNTNIPSYVDNFSCANYDKIIENNPIDVQILGVGSNGHIGFNEPGTSFNSKTHVVDLDESTRKDNARFFGGDINKVPKQAITMGISSILSAKLIVLIAVGDNKRKAIEMLRTKVITQDWPVTALNLHDNVVVYATNLLG